MNVRSWRIRPLKFSIDVPRYHYTTYILKATQIQKPIKQKISENWRQIFRQKNKQLLNFASCNTVFRFTKTKPLHPMTRVICRLLALKGLQPSKFTRDNSIPAVLPKELHPSLLLNGYSGINNSAFI